jgi:fructose-bisphosphate aldolase class II
MPLVGIKEILVDARKRRYGVPCLLAGNLEMIIGQIKAAEAKKSPLILAYNSGVTPQVPMDLAMPLIVNAASQANVPVASILDHGQSFDVVVQAIHLGSSSVMFDGSVLPYEENVKQTTEIVNVAHAVGVSVEAELGSVGGSSVEIGMNYELDSSRDPADYFTDPQMAADFVKRTGVDVLAISFGNAHGPYRGEPNLDLERVREIHKLVEIPLVMHGASGLTDDDYGRIIAAGISKINYYSAMGRSASQNLKHALMSTDDETIIFHQTISWAVDYFDTETQKLLDLLGCSGKAAK